MSKSFNHKICIKAVVTEPPGASCRKLIYNAGVVADNLGVELEIIKDKSFNEEEDKQLSPPFILFGDLVMGKDIEPDKLERLIRKRMNTIYLQGK